MNNIKKTVTVGIPAYNEEKNIGYLIRDLEAQELHSVVLEKILLYSDGSTDQTCPIIDRVRDTRIECVKSSERRGVTEATNYMFSHIESDILVFLNADIAIKDPLFLEKLTAPLVGGSADMTSCRLQALWPATFFEKILYAGHSFKNAVFEKYHSGQNLYTCHGPVRAFTRAVYSGMRFSESVADDMYSYLYAMKYTFRYQFVPQTSVYFRLPDSWSDHLCQSVRFFKSPEVVEKEFGAKFARQYLRMPYRVLFGEFILHLLRSPIRMSFYGSIALFMKVKSLLWKSPDIGTWEIAESSKQVEKNDARLSWKEIAFIAFRRLMYTMFGVIGRFASEKRNHVYVLCYHAVSDDAWKFSINQKVIERQIDYLLTKRKPVTLRDLELHVRGAKPITEPSFVVTFDDGYKDIMSMIPFMRARKIHPALFALAYPERANRRELETDRDFLSADDLVKLKKEEWGIGCHSGTHADFETLTKEGIEREVVEAKKSLESIIGIPVVYFAYPKGRYTEEVLDAVKRAGYALAFTVEDGFIEPGIARMRVPRIGVDRTHSLREFRGMLTACATYCRGLVRKRSLHI